MATIPRTQSFPVRGHQEALTQGTFRVVTWQGMTSGDVGAPLDFETARHTDRSVQVIGEFGTGSVVIEGSLDGENWSTLSDPQGNALSIQSAKIEAILEAVLYIRPRVAGGDVTTDVAVLIFLR